MKKLLLIIIGLVVFAGAVMVYGLPLVTNWEKLRQEWLAEVAQQTGLQISASGSIETTYFPLPEVHLGHITISRKTDAGETGLELVDLP
ncbi:MAG: AsmA family protein, partial [Rickettsiales bacterium]|nr:AsmA family protein [Rickettsiales bacterium]